MDTAAHFTLLFFQFLEQSEIILANFLCGLVKFIHKIVIFHIFDLLNLQISIIVGLQAALTDIADLCELTHMRFIGPTSMMVCITFCRGRHC